MKIYAPVKDFNGVHASVRFVNGVGETDNPHLIEWFRSHGYDVEDSNLVIKPENDEVTIVNEVIEQVIVAEDEDEMMGYADEPRKLEDMTPLELRELAKASGKGNLIKSIRNKEKLIEILRG